MSFVILTDYVDADMKPMPAFAPAIARGWKIEVGWTFYWHNLLDADGIPSFQKIVEALAPLPKYAKLMINREEKVFYAAQNGNIMANMDIGNLIAAIKSARDDVETRYYASHTAPTWFNAPHDTTGNIQTVNFANCTTTQRKYGGYAWMPQLVMDNSVEWAAPTFYAHGSVDLTTTMETNRASAELCRAYSRVRGTIPTITHHIDGIGSKPALTPSEFRRTGIDPVIEFKCQAAMWWCAGYMVGADAQALQALHDNVYACCDALPTVSRPA